MNKPEFGYSINSYGVVKYLKKRKRQLTNDQLKSIESNQQQSKGLEKEEEDRTNNLNKGFKRNNEISQRSKSNIIQRIHWLSYASKKKTYITKKGKQMSYKLQLITLTFAGNLDEKTSKKLLNNMLTALKKSHNLKNYVWKIELTKKGRIHYHIVTDSDLTLEITTKLWNQQLAKIGQKGKAEFNSTDIKRFSRHTTYIAKYLGKNEENEENPLKGRIWGSNRELNPTTIKKGLKEIAEYTYNLAQKIKIGTKTIKKDFVEIILIDYKKIMMVKDWRNEFYSRLRSLVNVVESTTTRYSFEIEEVFKRNRTYSIA